MKQLHTIANAKAGGDLFNVKLKKLNLTTLDNWDKEDRDLSESIKKLQHDYKTGKTEYEETQHVTLEDLIAVSYAPTISGLCLT